MLSRYSAMTEADCLAVLDLPRSIREAPRDSLIVREGDSAPHCTVLLSGYMFRQKIVTREGRRQILGVQFPGEIIDLQNSLLDRADHNVQALTRCSVAIIPAEALLNLSFERPGVGRAFWTACLVSGAIFRELAASLGRRDARSRIAHFLCEFGVRSELAGLGSRSAFELPMTQDHIADAMGLTPIHVNRSLRHLDTEGLIVRASRSVTIPDFGALAEAGDFSTDYLHIAPQQRSGDGGLSRGTGLVDGRAL
jgi:CRP-like cAMP-binding protein